MTVRQPAVAGSFYPAQPARLTSTILGFLDAAPPGPAAPVYVVPHAGYVYSGSTAALAYATLRAEPPSRVLVIGPTHRIAVRGLALAGATSYATPLGDVQVDAELTQRLAALDSVTTRPDVHAQEHSTEVQLPFLQVVAPGAEVVMVAAGMATGNQVAEAIDVAVELGATVLLSSDLSHYHPYDIARRIDRATVAQILSLAGPVDHDQACGATPVNGGMVAAARHGWRPRLLGQCTSGDTAGSRDRVVGYAAIAFEEGATDG